MMAHGGKAIFIRYNPDKYIDMNGDKKCPNTSTRLKILQQEIDLQINRINDEENTELIDITLLFYDNYT
jgi:hypothetical protein